MSPTELEKRLLVQRIDAHRQLLRNEIDAIGSRLRPVTSLAGWSRRLVPLWTTFGSAARSLRIDPRGRWSRWIRLAPLVLVALPLIKSLCGPDRNE